MKRFRVRRFASHRRSRPLRRSRIRRDRLEILRLRSPWPSWSAAQRGSHRHLLRILGLNAEVTLATPNHPAQAYSDVSGGGRHDQTNIIWIRPTEWHRAAELQRVGAAARDDDGIARNGVPCPGLRREEWPGCSLQTR